MHRTVVRLNIEHFRGKLATETDEAKRKVIARLLAEQEALLATLKDAPEKKNG